MDAINMPRENHSRGEWCAPNSAAARRRARLAARLPEMRLPAGKLREKADLIRCERAAKYASPAGGVQTVWGRSDSTAITSIVNGCDRRVPRNRLRKRRAVASAAAASASSDYR